MTAISRITARGQTTIHREIRQALMVGAGDTIAWDLEPGGTATVRRVQPIDLEYLQPLESTLDEWAGAADEEAYRDL